MAPGPIWYQGVCGSTPKMVQSTILENGVHVVTEPVSHVESVALGIWIGSGAKSETPEQYGLSHFLEHMLFKGTERRSAKDIADEMASVGGQINAATDREYTTYYIKVLKDDLPLGMDILCDMLLNSSFAPDEMEREKDVIAEEIRRHEDMPEDRVHDVLTELVWDGHALGHSVLGSEEVVRASEPGQLRQFRDTHYVPSRIVVSAAGNLEHERVVEMAAASPASPAQHRPCRRGQGHRVCVLLPRRPGIRRARRPQIFPRSPGCGDGRRDEQQAVPGGARKARAGVRHR